MAEHSPLDAVSAGPCVSFLQDTRLGCWVHTLQHYNFCEKKRQMTFALPCPNNKPSSPLSHNKLLRTILALLWGYFLLQGKNVFAPNLLVSAKANKKKEKKKKKKKNGTPWCFGFVFFYFLLTVKFLFNVWHFFSWFVTVWRSTWRERRTSGFVSAKKKRGSTSPSSCTCCPSTTTNR